MVQKVDKDIHQTHLAAASTEDRVTQTDGDGLLLGVVVQRRLAKLATDTRLLVAACTEY